MAVEVEAGRFTVAVFQDIAWAEKDTATITMTSGFGLCSVLYNQAGNINYNNAATVQENVKATQKPSITSADKTKFDIVFAGSFTITTTGNPATRKFFPIMDIT